MSEMLRCVATCSMSSGVNRDQTELFVPGGKEGLVESPPGKNEYDYRKQ